MVADLGPPRRLSAVGIASAQLARVAEAATGNFWVRTNPRPVDGFQDVLAMLRSPA